MKNKGRRHLAGLERPSGGSGNCKSNIFQLTRPIESMSSSGYASGRFDKKKWQKRIRNYMKHQKYQDLLQYGLFA